MVFNALLSHLVESVLCLATFHLFTMVFMIIVLR